MVRTSGIDGSDWAVAIGGVRGVSIRDIEGFLSRVREAVGGHVFQVFDAGSVAGWRHLFFSAVNAVSAIEGGGAISRSLGIEVLLYVSCVDQISRALEVVGVSPTTTEIALVVLAESAGEVEEAFLRAAESLGVHDDGVLELGAEKLDALKGRYGVSDAELEAVGGAKGDALTMLLVERGALLRLRR